MAKYFISLNKMFPSNSKLFVGTISLMLSMFNRINFWRRNIWLKLWQNNRYSYKPLFGASLIQMLYNLKIPMPLLTFYATELLLSNYIVEFQHKQKCFCLGNSY